MGPNTEELIEVLEQLAVLLEGDGDVHWSQWMRRARALLVSSDYRGVEYLLLAYGGMGSFNDVVLGQGSVDGVWAWKPGYVELNEAFDSLRGQAASLAGAIRRAQD